MATIRINLKNYEAPEFDETVATIDCWYDRHERLWVLQKLNKDGYQVGDAMYVYGKKDAKKFADDLRREYGIETK